MYSALVRADQELFLFLNGLHAAWADGFMIWVSGKLTWLPLYILLLGFLGYRFKKHVWLVVLAIVLTITVADQVSSAVIKPGVMRLRPCHDPLLAPDVHVLNGCGGMYGFVSSHAANTFGLAVFLWLLLGRHHRWISLFFLWAAVVSYSRIYLGVHYPLDLVGGWLVGGTAAWLSYLLYRTVHRRVYPHHHFGYKIKSSPL